MEDIKYTAIVEGIENGKYKITFPDFDNVFTTSDSEEAINKAASNLLKFKIKEYDENKIPLPQPSSIFDIQKNLKSGEISIYVTYNKNEGINLKSIDIKSVIKEEKVLNIYEKYKNNISLLKIFCAIMFIFSTFLGIVSFKVPFVGSFNITYLGGILSNKDFAAELLGFDSDIYKALITLRTIGLLLIFAGLFVIYTEYKNIKEYYSYSSYIPFGLSFIVLVLAKLSILKLDSHLKEFISLGLGVYLPVLIGIMLASIEYIRYVGEKRGSKK